MMSIYERLTPPKHLHMSFGYIPAQKLDTFLSNLYPVFRCHYLDNEISKSVSPAMKL